MKWSEELRRAVSRRAELPPDERNSISSEARVAMGAMSRAEEFAADNLARALRENAGRRPTGSEESADSRGDGPSGAATDLRQLLVMPVADRCNLACRYCYETERRAGQEPRRMRLDVFEQIIDNVLPFVQRPFDLALHGGEPLLVGKEWFVTALDRLRAAPGGERVNPIVQTNGTLLDEEWGDIFQEYDVGVGISMDGPPELHNAVRVDRKGRGSYEAVERGIRCLQEAGLDFGVITVVNTEQAGRESAAISLFDHFVDLGVRRMNVHPAFSHGDRTRDLNLSPAAYARFMNALFDRWLSHGDPGIQVGFFENFFQSMAGQPARACYLSGNCTTILGVGPEGEAIPCTRPFGPQHNFGNLAEKPVPEILSSPAFGRFEEKEREGQRPESTCVWRSHCSGGCPHERTADGQQNIAGRNVYCTCSDSEPGGYPAIFSHMHDRVEDVVRSALDLGPDVSEYSPNPVRSLPVVHG